MCVLAFSLQLVRNGNTALHEAVLTGDKDCIELLLK